MPLQNGIFNNNLAITMFTNVSFTCVVQVACWTLSHTWYTLLPSSVFAVA